MADDERESPSIAPPSMPWRRRREEPAPSSEPRASGDAPDTTAAPDETDAEPTRPLPTAPRSLDPVDVPPWDDVLDAPAVEQTSPAASAWADPTPREEYDRFYDAPAPTPTGRGRARQGKPPKPAREPKPAKPSRAERRAAAAPPIVPAPPVQATPAPQPVPTPPAPAPTQAAAPAPVPAAPRRTAKAPRPPKPAREPRRRVERSADRAPALDPRLAAALVGAVIGGAMAGLTYGALRGCGAIRGSETCGGAAGTLLLIAIIIVAVLLGRLVLDLLRIPEAGGTAVLGVALVCVLSLLFLSGSLTSAWMALVLPLLAAACFLGAHLASTAFEAE